MEAEAKALTDLEAEAKALTDLGAEAKTLADLEAEAKTLADLGLGLGLGWLAFGSSELAWEEPLT